MSDLFYVSAEKARDVERRRIKRAIDEREAACATSSEIVSPALARSTSPTRSKSGTFRAASAAAGRAAPLLHAL